jgi:predicted dehydrogenase
MKRRQFVAKTSAAVVGTALSARRVRGANERVNVALIGCGTRGRLLANLVKQTPGAAVTALCDVYDAQVAPARESASEGARAFKDFRQVLDQKDIDAIVVATPDHWHGIIAIGRVPDADPPAGLDWDLYLGPAPLVPFDKARFLSTYRWFWDYAGGWVTDYGTHRFDSFHQVMGVDAPRTVVATGGRFGLKDSGETPDLVQATYEYPGFIMSYEVCALNAHGAGGRTPEMAYYQMRGEFDRPHGEAYYGTNGSATSPTGRAGSSVGTPRTKRSRATSRRQRRSSAANIESRGRWPRRPAAGPSGCGRGRREGIITTGRG